MAGHETVAASSSDRQDRLQITSMLSILATETDNSSFICVVHRARNLPKFTGKHFVTLETTEGEIGRTESKSGKNPEWNNVLHWSVVAMISFAHCSIFSHQ